ncbi:DUF4446 family protein [Pectinatus cerevisiiphilus]|uniref:Uncharacterized protein DUF4446 n=1 Tax=Pectinatus cerevisiiphilus TaxID=86956 RepID=A0A4R3KF97_9FIRM|nr:DUF4446 family protein [Pectinatus cerevisiiphilus]TCS81860.1 uncharacterized protein DUF4446 [Pectinatus cerevisiiphilus]
MTNGSIGTLNDAIIYVIAAMAVLILIAYIIAVVLMVKLGNMKSRYKEMMRGSNTENLEQMLLEHMHKVKDITEQNAEIKEENKQIRDILQNVVQKVGVVRFSAFDDVGGDLSYAVALLDRTNTGIILSGIFSRNSSITYMKPVDQGHSVYKLSAEENEALEKAIAKG